MIFHDFPWNKPSSYRGSTILGNLQMVFQTDATSLKVWTGLENVLPRGTSVASVATLVIPERFTLW